MSMKPVNVKDYRILAQSRLPKIIFDHLESGADDEIGMKHNREVSDLLPLDAAPPEATFCTPVQQQKPAFHHFDIETHTQLVCFGGIT
jgi:hypothetical protein